MVTPIIAPPPLRCDNISRLSSPDLFRRRVTEIIWCTGTYLLAYLTCTVPKLALRSTLLSNLVTIGPYRTLSCWYTEPCHIWYSKMLGVHPVQTFHSVPNITAQQSGASVYQSSQVYTDYCSINWSHSSVSTTEEFTTPRDF